MYVLKPSQADKKFFFADNEVEMVRLGSMGRLRADFGRSGEGFYSTWFNHSVSMNAELKTRDFSNELDDIINSLRDDGVNPPFNSRKNLSRFCCETPGLKLDGRGDGYEMRTPNYTYFFRCKPCVGDYDIYCYCYCNKLLYPELETSHE